MNVVVNGLMTNYQKIGKGKSLLFLHGWGDSSATFSDLVKHLQDKYEIYSLDLPGFGGTQAPAQAWGLSDYADFIEAWLKKLSIKNLRAIIGHSYGGAATITCLAEGKVKADKLVLIASSGVRSRRSIRKRVLKATSKVGKLPLYLLPSQKRRRVREKVYKTLGSDMLSLPHMELTFKRIIGEDVQATARQIKTPTLLIYGTKDKDTPVKDGRLLNQAIANSELEIINGGHFVHQEQPAGVADLIVDFVERK